MNPATVPALDRNLGAVALDNIVRRRIQMLLQVLLQVLLQFLLEVLQSKEINVTP